MPTLAVPTRRPFTEQGKALGRLKLLVAGDTGIGYNTTNDHLRRSMMSGLDESNVLSTISNGGGVLVDAVIFMIPGCEPKTSIIPVLAQADTMTSAQIDCSKELILRQLAKANLAPFIFHDSTPTVAEVPIVFAVSSHSSTDEENMDASILMNPDYIPPLAPSDLTALLEHIFSIEGSSRLRHATARKLTAK
ncbi:hypothetical protein HYQ45_005965 [Verticillium longisporum]|uniref:Septin-type G domain-containing protein n=1 Tax=Verticillium longisporum TaxID=100787 RepID=A0A8I2ZRW9_VERLO|nr:hypothetical protein HYQ45_005965 [Verticillium longisporum]